MSADTPSPVSPLPFDGERAKRLLALLAAHLRGLAKAQDSLMAVSPSTHPVYIEAQIAADELRSDADFADSLAAALPAILDARKDGERWLFARKVLATHLRSRWFPDVNGPEMYVSAGAVELRCGASFGMDADLVTQAIDRALSETRTPEPSDVQR